MGALTMGVWRELDLAIATRDGLQLIVVKLDAFFFGDHQGFFLAFAWFALSCLRNVGIRLASPYCPAEGWQKAPLKISSPLIRIIGDLTIIGMGFAAEIRKKPSDKGWQNVGF